MATSPPVLTTQQVADLANKAAYYSLMKIVGQKADMVIIGKTAQRASSYANTLTPHIDRRLVINSISEAEANKLGNTRGKTHALVVLLDTILLTAEARTAYLNTLQSVAAFCTQGGFTTTTAGLLVLSK